MTQFAQLSTLILGALLLVGLCAWLGRGYFGTPGKHGGGVEGSLRVSQLVDQTEREPRFATIAGDLAGELAELEQTAVLGPMRFGDSIDGHETGTARPYIGS
ncbi:hypothetical protein [Saccharopolyspora endophytica]|uniref:Uncharacterized protein n=1 Tax=Saccharopolyspora endophytica TaxID=543886 RepID=A0ABS5DQJ8_9PSEU|nr:hypothetical protein [Saccharopolyspora endophytica]MBQ0928571.1 hypothetical protein [Saccharopolyspora endophytica]